MVCGRKPVQEEHATAQGEGAGAAGARQQRTVAGRARHAEQNSAPLVELLLLRGAAAGIPRRRLLRLRARARLPRQAAQSGRARYASVLLRGCLRGTRPTASRTPALTCYGVCLVVEPIAG